MGRRWMLAIGIMLAAGTARAQPCAVSPAEAAQRRALIERQLEADVGPSRLWNTGWAVGFAAASGGAAVMSFHPEWTPLLEADDSLQATYVILSIKSAIAASARLVLPLRVRRVPPATGDPCADLAAAEQALAWTARKQRRTYWLSILGGSTLHLAGALVIGLGYDDWVGAGLGVASGALVTTIMALTQPVWSWHLYRDGVARTGSATRSWTLTPDVAPGRAGLMFTIHL